VKAAEALSNPHKKLAKRPQKTSGVLDNLICSMKAGNFKLAAAPVQEKPEDKVEVEPTPPERRDVTDAVKTDTPKADANLPLAEPSTEVILIAKNKHRSDTNGRRATNCRRPVNCKIR